MREKEEEMAQQRLQNYIDTLKNEGIMDGEYEETRRVENLPNVMMDLINSFLVDTDNIIRELADLLSATNVDFDRVNIAADVIMGGGYSLGGCRVVAAARALRIATVNEDKQSCKTSHERMINEYYLFREKLRTLYEMEKEIVNIESRRRI